MSRHLCDHLRQQYNRRQSRCYRACSISYPQYALVLTLLQKPGQLLRQLHIIDNVRASLKHCTVVVINVCLWKDDRMYVLGDQIFTALVADFVADWPIGQFEWYHYEGHTFGPSVEYVYFRL